MLADYRAPKPPNKGFYAKTAENSASLLDNGFIGQNRLIFASSDNDITLKTAADFLPLRCAKGKFCDGFSSP